MNIQNISALAEQLETLGFETAGYTLLKKVCFKPLNFCIAQKINKGQDQLSTQILFERDIKHNVYSLMYYDASLQRETVLSEIGVNGINLKALDKQMAAIDWKEAFNLNERKRLDLKDKLNWETEQMIEAIVDDLAVLTSNEEGKSIAVNLKLKYWAEVANAELVGNITPLKSKSEICQRFYFTKGQDGISVDEAYRFLQNRWLEKQMQAKLNSIKKSNATPKENEPYVSSAKRLSKKKTLLSSSTKLEKANNN